MKLLSLQSFSLFSNGGGSRVLRRLYKGNEHNVFSIAVLQHTGDKKGDISEKIIKVYPGIRRWMRWYLRNFFSWLSNNVLHKITVNRIRAIASNVSYDVIHVVNQDPYSTALCQENFLKGKELWVSFHDHFSIVSCLKDAKMLWKQANRRMVISKQLGLEYSKLFGTKDFEIITDGVEQNEISEPLISEDTEIKVYFAGLLHIDYLPLFKVMAEALDILTKEGYSFKFIIRGISNVDFLNNRLFITEYHDDFISDNEIKKELDSASILYLPIKFSHSDFYLYSLSTKMISYLGASGTILYHGPANSAACTLLQDTSAALCCTSLNTSELIFALKALKCSGNIYSSNSKVLAKQQFDMEWIRRNFWRG